MRADAGKNGQQIFHGDADKENTVAQIDRDFARFRRSIEPDALTGTPPIAAWWRDDVLPMLSEWERFRDAEIRSWFTRAATSWEAYRVWFDRLRQARTFARILGIPPAGPEPTPPPRTLFEAAEAGAGNTPQQAWTVGRTLLYTALGAAGIAALARGRS
jgi:hypothetical protein